MATIQVVPNELILEIIWLLIWPNIVKAFDAYAAPIDACVLRPRAEVQHPEHTTLCVQDQPPVAYSPSDVTEDPVSWSQLYVEQARGAQHCYKFASAVGLVKEVRRLVRVCKRWQHIITHDTRLWPCDSAGNPVKGDDPLARLHPVSYVVEEERFTFLALDPLCSCAFEGSAQIDWITKATHLSLSLPRTRPERRGRFRSIQSLTTVFQMANNLVYLDLRGTYPTHSINRYASNQLFSRAFEADPFSLPRLRVARLINCEFILTGPMLRVFHFVCMFDGTLSLAALLSVLSRAQELEVLHLRTGILLSDSEHGNDLSSQTLVAQTSLPKLRHLVASLRPRSIQTLLFMLDLPSGVSMHLEAVKTIGFFENTSPRGFVPFLFAPDRSRDLASMLHNHAGYNAYVHDVMDVKPPHPALSEFVPIPRFPPEVYSVVGVTLGVNRGRSRGRRTPVEVEEGPEFHQLVLSGSVEQAVRCMSGTSCDAGTIYGEESVPSLSVAIRVTESDTEVRRLMVDSSVIFGEESFSLDICRLVIPLADWGVIHPAPTMVLGQGSYCPKSVFEWYKWLRHLKPRVLVVTEAVFDAGEEVTPRGFDELKQLAEYLAAGYEPRLTSGAKLPRVFDQTLERVEVSKALRGCSKKGLEELEKQSKSSAKYSKRSGLVTRWVTYSA